MTGMLLDTCVILWAVSAPGRLSERARTSLEEAGAEVFASAISSAEIACGCERGRLELDRHWKAWFRHFLKLNEWECLPMDLAVVEEAYSLPSPFHRDPADRIIVATARIHGLTVVTADEKILDYPHVDVLW